MKFESKEVISVEPALVRIYKNQPRSWIDPEKVKELAESFSQIGEQTEPGILRRLKNPGPNGEEFELIAGQRRWEACKRKGRPFEARVAIVTDEKEQFKVAFVDNIQRDSLALLDLCRGLERLHKDGMSQKDIGKLCGERSQGWVWKRIQILQLPPPVLEMMGPKVLEDKRLTFSSALKLLEATPSKTAQVKLAKAVAGQTVIKTKRIISEKLGANVSSLPSRVSQRKTEEFRNFYINFENFSDRLKQRLKMPVAEFTALLKGGSSEEIDNLIGFLVSCERSCETLKEMVKNFAKTKK